MEGPTPSDAIDETEFQSDAAGGQTEAPGPGDVPPEPDSSGLSITDILMETRPDESPQRYAGQDEYVAHAIIGLKKCLNAVTDGKMDSGGVPAIQNFAMSGVGFLLSPTGTDDSPDEPEPQPDGRTDSV